MTWGRGPGHGEECPDSEGRARSAGTGVGTPGRGLEAGRGAGTLGAGPGTRGTRTTSGSENLGPVCHLRGPVATRPFPGAGTRGWDAWPRPSAELRKGPAIKPGKRPDAPPPRGYEAPDESTQ